MPNVADYVILNDNPKTLQIGGDIDETYTFSLPSNLINSAGATNRAFITVQLEVEVPNALKWKMEINGTEILNLTHNLDRFGTLQEVFGAQFLKTGSNSAKVQVVSGQGRLELADIVLHFQVEV
jgi:hypothetical protein